MVVMFNVLQSLLGSSSLPGVLMGFWVKDLFPLVSVHCAGCLPALFLTHYQEANSLPMFLLPACFTSQAPCWALVVGLGRLLASTEAALFCLVPNGVDEIGCPLSLGELMHVSDKGFMRMTYFQGFGQRVVLTRSYFCRS